MRFLVLAFLCIALPANAQSIPPETQRSQVQAAWTELVGRTPTPADPADAGEVVLRVITTSTVCPAASADGRPLALQVRQLPSAAFAVTTCQSVLPRRVRHILVDGRSLSGWPRRLRRIVVIGDTGCRLKGALIQDCNDPQRWPFALVAAQAAAKRPDLIIHVGDYYYRETPCPPGTGGCAGSPHGDAWPSWQADFFAPVTPLLSAAPWIFVRGNHEQCGRGADGWFRFLDAASEPQKCIDSMTSAPFTVRLRGLTMNVMDSADTDDTTAPAALVDLFRKQFQQLGAATETGHGWILTHRPIWGLDPHNLAELTSPAYKQPVPKPLPPALPGYTAIDLYSNRSEQVAAHGLPLAGTDMIVSGHIHLFTTLSFGHARPVQLIVGNGGDNPNVAVAGPAVRKEEIDGLEADIDQLLRYGFFVLDRTRRGWTGTAYSITGTTLATCQFAGRKASCELSSHLPPQLPAASGSSRVPSP